jgi:uroporphyrinogen-III synthase
MRPLVIVRPQPGASATAEAARKLGLDAVLMPLFAIEPIEWEVPATADFDALLFTSANALRFAGAGLERLKSLPACCVGETTAEAARDRGFAIHTTGNGGVDLLLERLPAGLRLLHLCGTDWRQPQRPRQGIVHLPLYRSAELAAPGIDRIEGSVVAVHSPRAASVLERLAGAAAVDRAKVAIAAISSAAAEAAGGGWECVQAAAEPTDAALLAIAARLCNNRG